MGTRSLTVMQDGKREIAVLYRQMDGYPSGHGEELKEFLAGFRVVNGYSMSETQCLNCGADKYEHETGKLDLKTGERTPVNCSLYLAPKAANGMSNLAVQLIAHFNDGVGGFYLHPAKTRDAGEEFIYTVYEKDGRVFMRVQGGRVTFFGLPGTKQKSMPVLYDGPADEFSAESADEVYANLREEIPNEFVEGKQRQDVLKAVGKAARKGKRASRAS